MTLTVNGKCNGRDYRLQNRGDDMFGSICLSVRPFGFVRHMLCTTSWVHHRPALSTMVRKGPMSIWSTDVHNIVHNVALYWLGGAQDDFACSLSTLTMMVHNMLLSVWVSLILEATLCTTSTVLSYSVHHQPVKHNWDLFFWVGVAWNIFRLCASYHWPSECEGCSCGTLNVMNSPYPSHK